MVIHYDHHLHICELNGTWCQNRLASHPYLGYVPLYACACPMLLMNKHCMQWSTAPAQAATSRS